MTTLVQFSGLATSDRSQCHFIFTKRREERLKPIMFRRFLILCFASS